MKSKRIETRVLTGVAIFTAIVVVLQLLGSFVRFGPFSVSLVLIPIVVGAAMYGAGAGAWLGFVFGKELFVRFFTAEADVAEFAYIRMCTLLPFYFLVPLYEVGGAALRGIGHSLAPAVLTVLGTCVLRLIWVFTVCRIWPDYRVLMLVYPITWALTGAAIMVCYFLVDRKLAKKFLTAQTH